MPVPIQAIAHITTPTKQREDPNNANPTTKALIDGLTDHHCWADDDSEHVLGPDHRRGPVTPGKRFVVLRSEEHTSELQSLMRISYAVFCLKKKQNKPTQSQLHSHIYTLHSQ